MGRVLLVSPTPSQMPYLWPIWQTNRAIAVSAYLVVITVAGLTVIGYQTVQTRYTVAELGPRLVVGFVAANLSWWGCEQATTAANALTRAVLGTGLDLNTAPAALRQVLELGDRAAVAAAAGRGGGDPAHRRGGGGDDPGRHRRRPGGRRPARAGAARAAADRRGGALVVAALRRVCWPPRSGRRWCWRSGCGC